MRRPLAPCKAHALAERLTDLELLTLKASQYVRKRGVALRVFGEDDLRMPGLLAVHEAGDATIRESLHGLVRKGMLGFAGRKAYAATTDGNAVKHAFNDLEDSLRAGPGAPRGADPLDRIRDLRERMRKECAESRAN
jgi:hypothetical protein